MISQLSSRLKLGIVLCQTIWLSSCANLPYYAQALNGHMDILRQSQPISAIIAHPETDIRLKRILTKVVQLRQFASHELKLPDNQSYTSYADLQRPYAVWNVFAAPEFSVQLKKWCFIKAGCVSYRGFFSKTRAERYAQKLKNQGYDVYVGGVRAYSTLGWSNDPILNTFISYSEIELAQLIFHELAHQVVYVPGNSVFNESFATAVEQEGVRRWFAYNGSPLEQAALNSKQEMKMIFTDMILNHRKRLNQLYASNKSVTEKRAEKARIFDELREEFSQLKAVRAEFSHYDLWFSKVLNNARLATVSVYTQLLPAFQTLLAQQNGDMKRFYQVVKEISKMPEHQQVAVMRAAYHRGTNAAKLSKANYEIHE